MSVANFIPTIWAARVKANLNKALVSSSIVNRDYEQAAQSGSARINQLGQVAVSTHTKGGTVSYQDPYSLQQTFNLDQREIAAFKVDDLDAVEANINLVENYSRRLGYSLAEAIDYNIFSQYTAAGVADVAIDVIAVSASEVRDAFADMKANLMLNRATGQPWVVLSPRAAAAMFKDTTILQATDTDAAALRAGFLGMFMGFNIFVSNSLSGTGVTVQTDGAASQGDTSITVDALSAAVPAGTIIRFGAGQEVRTTATAASSATSITVEALTTDIADNTAGTYVKVSKCVYGTNDAITFGMNLNPMVEALRDKDTTDDYIRAEQNYGRLVLEPYALGTLTTTEIS